MLLLLQILLSTSSSSVKRQGGRVEYSSIISEQWRCKDRDEKAIVRASLPVRAIQMSDSTCKPPRLSNSDEKDEVRAERAFYRANDRVGQRESREQRYNHTPVIIQQR